MENMTGIPGKTIRCEECGNHVATLNVELPGPWGTICLCGLCSLQMMLVLMDKDSAVRV